MNGVLQICSILFRFPSLHFLDVLVPCDGLSRFSMKVKADAHYEAAAKSLQVPSSPSSPSSSSPFLCGSNSNANEDEDAKMRAKKLKEAAEQVKKAMESAAVAARQAYNPPLPPVGRVRAKMGKRKEGKKGEEERGENECQCSTVSRSVQCSCI